MVGLKNEQRACVMNKRSIVVNIGSGGMMEDERYLFGRSGEASGSRIGPVGFGKKFKYLREGEKKGVFLPPHGFRCLASLQFFTLYLEFRADFFFVKWWWYCSLPDSRNGAKDRVWEKGIRCQKTVSVKSVPTTKPLSFCQIVFKKLLWDGDWNCILGGKNHGWNFSLLSFYVHRARQK